jgi:hypothetical protein
MRSHIEACKASGITVKAYCLQHQLSYSNYYYWQKKLQPQQAGKFISITPPLPMAGVSITFANGNRISFESMPPVEYVKQLMS